MKNLKPTLLLQLPPLHLFWTTGVYYIWQLKDKYDFILLCYDDYLKDKNFRKICRMDFVKEVKYLAINNTLKRHIEIKKSLNYFFQNYAIDKVLINNINYFENQYVVYFARNHKPNISINIYQTSRVTQDFKADRRLVNRARVHNLLENLPFGHKLHKLGMLYLGMRDKIVFMLNFKILPSLILDGTTFKPKIDIYTGHRFDKSISDKNITLFYYYDIDRGYLENLYSAQRYIKISHPVYFCSKELMEMLGQIISEEHKVIILPSDGLVEELLTHNRDKAMVVNQIGDSWIRILDKLKKTYPKSQYSIKLHPNYIKDSVWTEIINHIKNKHGNLVHEKTKESAEYHILDSSIIIGDISTCLWWAAFLPNKMVISFDVFGYLRGADMKCYQPKIIYCNDVEKLKIEKNYSNDKNTSTILSYI